MKKLVILISVGLLSACSSATTSVAENKPPIASFSINATSGVAPFFASVDAQNSSDSDGQISSYVWNWGDSSSNGVNIGDSHTYNNAGTYKITLTVTDNAGASKSSFKNVVVTASIVVPAKTYNQLQAERLLGYWQMNYKIISYYTDRYTLALVEEQPSKPGEYIALGTYDLNGSLAGGLYDQTVGKFIIVNIGTLFNQAYVFNFSPTTSNSTAVGCYYIIIHPADNLSSCYSLLAQRSSSRIKGINPLNDGDLFKVRETSVVYQTKGYFEDQRQYEAVKEILERK
jgi:PKD repeat protein